MGLNEYIVNIFASVIAIEYMDYGFEKKYVGLKRWTFFFMGCGVYFFVVTGMNQFVNYEGILCVLYGGALMCYGSLALRGSLQDKVIINLMWILITLLSTFTIFCTMGMLTGKNMQDMMQIKGFAFLGASLAAGLMKFLMGRIVVKFYGKRDGMHEKESWMVAGTLVLNLLIGLGMFRLELVEMPERERYGLILCILAGEFGGILFLETVHKKLSEYQKAKLELEFREKQAKSRRENMMDIYQISREINHWRHDMTEKIEVLHRLQEKGCFREVGEKIGALCEGLRKYPELPQETGNEGLNVALMKAIVRCREAGIRFRYVVLGKVNKVDSMDMGNIMWNLFINGIEV